MLLAAGASQVRFLVNRRKMNNSNFWLTINLKLYFNKQLQMNAALAGKFATKKHFLFLFSLFFSFFPFSLPFYYFYFCFWLSGNTMQCNSVQNSWSIHSQRLTIKANHWELLNHSMSSWGIFLLMLLKNSLKYIFTMNSLQQSSSCLTCGLCVRVL